MESPASQSNLEQEFPPGFKLRNVLTGHGDVIPAKIKKELELVEIEPTTMPLTFKEIKSYVLSLKEELGGERILLAWDSLRQKLEATNPERQFSDEDMQTAVQHLAKQSYVRILRTSKGEERVLLKPEMVNNLASSFVLEGIRNPQGLGALDEELIRINAYRFKELEGLTNEEAGTLLDAVTALFIEHNVAFRKTLGRTKYLIFPQLISRKKSTSPQVNTYEGGHILYSDRTGGEHICIPWSYSWTTLVFSL
jgi:hypothetical protein